MSPNRMYLEWFGWLGLMAMIGAYALYGMGILPASSLVYQALNLFGALGIAAISFSRKVWQPGLLGLFWAGIAIYALYAYINA